MSYWDGEEEELEMEVEAEVRLNLRSLLDNDRVWRWFWVNSGAEKESQKFYQLCVMILAGDYKTAMFFAEVATKDTDVESDVGNYTAPTREEILSELLDED